MKYLCTLILVLVFQLGHSQTGSLTTQSMQHDGETREYLLYVPTIYDATEDVPLVINLHGYTSSMTDQLLYGEFRPIADTANFILAVPNGLTDGYGNQYWNYDNVINGSDDIGFLSALIDELSEEYSINPNRIYFTGMSNGGFMSHYLACNLSDKVTAIASVTGTMIPLQINMCNPQKSIPVMQIHGTADAIVPYDGNFVMASVDAVVNHWVNNNGCNHPPVTTELPDVNPNDNSTVTHYVFYNDDNEGLVELYKIEGGGHTWPNSIIDIPAYGPTNRDFSASKEIWRFFSQFPNENSLNISEETLSKIKLFPNPSNGHFTIQTEEVTDKIIIYSVDGKHVRTILNPSTDVEISGMKSGVYLVHLEKEKSTTILKMIVD